MADHAIDREDHLQVRKGRSGAIVPITNISAADVATQFWYIKSLFGFGDGRRSERRIRSRIPNPSKSDRLVGHKGRVNWVQTRQ
jgi:hypothetical protein